MDAALLLGIIGTVLSAVALGWNIFRDVMDAGRLRVECGFGEPFGTFPLPSGEVLLWTVTNVGKRRVIVREIGGTRTDSQARFIMIRPLGHELPHRLEPGEYAMFWTNRFDQLPASGHLASLYARDTLDRYFRASRRSLRNVRHRLRRIQAGTSGGDR